MEGISQKLDDLRSALSGGVASVELGAAKSLIAGFKGQLESASEPSLTRVAADLGGLHEALSASPLDPATIGQHLSKVSSSVQEVSEMPGAPAILGEIADRLRTEGTKLSG